MLVIIVRICIVRDNIRISHHRRLSVWRCCYVRRFMRRLGIVPSRCIPCWIADKTTLTNWRIVLLTSSTLLSSHNRYNNCSKSILWPKAETKVVSNITIWQVNNWEVLNIKVGVNSQIMWVRRRKRRNSNRMIMRRLRKRLMGRLSRKLLITRHGREGMEWIRIRRFLLSKVGIPSWRKHLSRKDGFRTMTSGLRISTSNGQPRYSTSTSSVCGRTNRSTTSTTTTT